MCDQPVSMDTLYTIPRYGHTGGVGVDDGKVLRGSRWNWMNNMQLIIILLGNYHNTMYVV